MSRFLSLGQPVVITTGILRDILGFSLGQQRIELEALLEVINHHLYH